MQRLTSIKERLGMAARSLMSLAELPHGAAAFVVGVEGCGAAALRLIEMGIVPGASIRVVKAAPLGDPIQICVRDYHLALRRVDAEKISVVTTCS